MLPLISKKLVSQLILQFQNAIMVVITFFDNLANRESTQPMSRGLLAIKPKNKESKIPLDVRILNNHSGLLGILLENLFGHFLPRANFTADPNYLLQGTQNNLMSYPSVQERLTEAIPFC
jgi:hypothetical protein